MKSKVDKQLFRNTFFPKHCVSCHITGDYLCKKCRAKLKPYIEVCTLCNCYSQGYDICNGCKKQYYFKIEKVIVGFYYDSVIKKLILNLKYRHKYDVVSFLAERILLLAKIYLGSEILTNTNTVAIMGIPSHRWRKYMVKGYNQSQLLAKATAKKLQVCYINPIKKIKNTTSQVKLNKSQRMKNLRNSFILKKNSKQILSGLQYIILVDDITTTGVSLNTIAKTIKDQYPNIKIYGIVLAKK